MRSLLLRTGRTAWTAMCGSACMGDRGMGSMFDDGGRNSRLERTLAMAAHWLAAASASSEPKRAV